MIRVLSLGAGVQSSTLLLMSCLGELPLLDAAVFADTQWEPAEVYKHLDWLTEYAAKAGIPVHRVTAGPLRSSILERQVPGGRKEGFKRFAAMPLYITMPNGSSTIMRRQCTHEHKIRPLQKFVRDELLHLPKFFRGKEVLVERWIGFSADESGRMSKKRQHARWEKLHYPLIYDCNTYATTKLFDAGFTREDCLTWLERNKFPMAPRSACIGCPFHSDAEWQRLTQDEFRDACEFDDSIRVIKHLRGQAFIHRSRLPLRDVVFDVKKNWDGVRDNECLGMCGA